MRQVAHVSAAVVRVFVFFFFFVFFSSQQHTRRGSNFAAFSLHGGLGLSPAGCHCLGGDSLLPEPSSSAFREPVGRRMWRRLLSFGTPTSFRNGPFPVKLPVLYGHECRVVPSNGGIPMRRTASWHTHRREAALFLAPGLPVFALGGGKPGAGAGAWMEKSPREPKGSDRLGISAHTGGGGMRLLCMYVHMYALPPRRIQSLFPWPRCVCWRFFWGPPEKGGHISIGPGKPDVNVRSSATVGEKHVTGTPSRCLASFHLLRVACGVDPRHATSLPVAPDCARRLRPACEKGRHDVLYVPEPACVLSRTGVISSLVEF